MPDLVAVPASGRPFVEELERCWDAGDAVLPVDVRLPDRARDRLLDALRPTVVVDADGTRRSTDGEPADDGDALVVATSGTTGTPKGVVLTHAAVAASAEATSAFLEVDPTSDRWLACLPLAHVGGLSVVTRSLVTGTPFEELDGFDAAAVDHSDATLVSLVGTALARIDATRWRRIVLGGGPPPPDRPPNSVATYGLTETGSGVVYDGWPLNGVGLRLATLLKVKVYVMGLYLEEKSADPKAIMASTGNKRISMDFVHEVSADQLRGGWQEGFDKNFPEKDAVKAEIEQFNAAMSDVTKGDRIVIDFSGSAVEVQVKGAKAATIDNAKFQQAVLSIWLGSKPPNREIKDGILGKD